MPAAEGSPREVTRHNSCGAGPQARVSAVVPEPGLRAGPGECGVGQPQRWRHSDVENPVARVPGGRQSTGVEVLHEVDVAVLRLADAAEVVEERKPAAQSEARSARVREGPLESGVGPRADQSGVVGDDTREIRHRYRAIIADRQESISIGRASRTCALMSSDPAKSVRGRASPGRRASTSTGPGSRGATGDGRATTNATPPAKGMSAGTCPAPRSHRPASEPSAS